MSLNTVVSELILRVQEQRTEFMERVASKANAVLAQGRPLVLECICVIARRLPVA